MNQVKLLPEHIIDQIKAGEVIERPATLIKELLENSLDAGATKIKIEILGSGMDVISIEDNGHGMSHDDLPLAFCRHATSKLEQFNDLYKLRTYGFRGEALASASSVSKVTCYSNLKNAPRSIYKIEGGLEVSHHKEEKDYKESGTIIHIKDLFFNTPVRMKFIQSKTSEKNQINKIINAFVLTHPHVEFNVTIDELKVKYHKTTTQNLSKRIKDIFEKRNDPLDIIDLEGNYDGFTARLLLTRNSYKGNRGKFSYVFINDRVVNDIQIHKIITNSATCLWNFNQTGSYCIFIDVPTDQLDVNVHPNKTVVKIFQAPKLFSLISSLIKQFQSKELRSHNDESQEQKDFSSLDLKKDLSEVSYKEQDFNTTSLQSYFDNLDNKVIIKEPSTNYIYSDEILSILRADEKNSMILINNKKLYLFHLEELLKKKDIETTPLLISEPIELNKKYDYLLDSIDDLGFELDRLDESTLALRSYPASLKELPYLELLKLFIANIKKSKDLFYFSQKDFSPAKIPSSILDTTLKKYGKSKLLELGIIRIVTTKSIMKEFL